MLKILGTIIMVASAASPAPYGDRDLTNISLENAYHLPSIVIADATLEQKNNSLTGSFTAVNQEPDIIGGWQYNLEIWNAGPEQEILYDREAFREQHTLAGKERKIIPFSYAVPALPESEYTFRIQIVTADGRALGWHDKTISAAGTGNFATIEDTSLRLPGVAEIIDDPLTGPNVSPTDTFTVQADITATANATLVPVLEVYQFDIARGNPAVTRFDSVTVSANKTTSIDLKVIAPEKPEVYSAYLKLVDPATDKTVSSLGEYRWVVRGADAGVFPPRISRLATKKNDTTRARIDYVGPADAETRLTGNLKVTLLDDRGEVVSLDVPNIALSDTIGSGIATLQLPRDIVGTSRIHTTITDESDNVLDDAEVSLTLENSSTKPKVTKTIVASIVVSVIILGIAIYLLTKKQLRA